MQFGMTAIGLIAQMITIGLGYNDSQHKLQPSPSVQEQKTIMHYRHDYISLMAGLKHLWCLATTNESCTSYIKSVPLMSKTKTEHQVLR